MSQHDFDIANAMFPTLRADLNNALQALASVSSGASAPSTTYAYMLWADITNGLLKQRNAANSGWIIRGTLTESFLVSKSAGYTVAIGDFGKMFKCTSSFTLALTAAATLGDGFMFYVRNTGSGTITIDPNSTEQINGATTISLAAGDSCAVFCDGTGFFTISGVGGLTSASISALTSLTGASTAPDDEFIVNDVSASTVKKQTREDLAVFALGTITTDRKLRNESVTLNNSGVTFSIDVTDVTDTASNAASLLKEWKVGGGTKAAVVKNGQFLSGYTATNSPTYSFVGDTTTGWGYRASGTLTALCNGLECLRIAGSYQWLLGYLMLGGSFDATLSRTGAAKMALGNGSGDASGQLDLKTVRPVPVTVATLPAASTAGNGARAHVTDASAPTWGAAVTGGGAVSCPVFSTGSAWNVG